MNTRGLLVRLEVVPGKDAEVEALTLLGSLPDPDLPNVIASTPDGR